MPAASVTAASQAGIVQNREAICANACNIDTPLPNTRNTNTVASVAPWVVVLSKMRFMMRSFQRVVNA